MWRIRTDDTSLKSIDGICHSKLLYCNLKDRHSTVSLLLAIFVIFLSAAA